MNAFRTTIAVLSVLAIAGMAGAQATSDQAILQNIRLKVPPTSGVVVAVNGGIATLTGTVPSLAQKNGYLTAAQRTIGVNRVIDHIRVVPTVKVSDDKITASVHRSLIGNLSKQEVSSINVSTKGGVVTLTGTLVGSYGKQLAGLLASWAPGVTDLRNNIVVKPSELRSDLNIESDVRARFQKNPFISGQRISISVTNSVVTLSGVVDSDLAAEQAESIARFAPGVVEVINLLHIRGAGPVQ